MGHTNKQEQLALLLTYQLLRELSDPKRLAVVSERVREQANVILRHFPGSAKIGLLYDALKRMPPDEL